MTGGDTLKSRILVCGGRDFNDRDRLIIALDQLCDERGWNTPPSDDGNYLPDVTIISGCARGADRMAIDWAVVNWQPWEEYPANWDKFGKAAGIIRNKQMLDEGKPDIVVAFPGGRGTAHMMKIARAAGIEVIER